MWPAGVSARALLLAVASGVAVGATFSPHGGPVLPFLAFAPLAAALAGRSASPFAPGCLTAVLAHGIGLCWMVPALSWRTGLAVPVYVLVLVMIGIVAGAATTAAVTLHRRRRWPLPLSLAMCWTGFEWTAAHVPGVSYAWLNSGASLAWYPTAAAGAELLGARLLTVWTVASGALAAAILTGARTEGLRGTAGRVLLLAGLVGMPLAAGHLRQRGLTVDGPLVRVAMVQAGDGGGQAGDGGAQGGDGGGQTGDGAQAGDHGGLTRWIEPLRELGEAEGVDIAVFPERHLATALRDPVTRAPSGAGLEAVRFAAASGTPVLVGALDAEVADGAAGDTLWYNAAFALSPDGTLSRAYRKRSLVPGLEGAGLVGGAFGSRNRGYAVGRGTRLLEAPGGPVGAMVCYDSAYGETARALVRAGAGWLAVLSNDDWLDPELPLRVTWAYWQHATHGRLRAIENRIGLVQVAATGYTFAVAPDGSGPESLLEPGAEGVAVAGVGRRAATTLFTRIGDVLGFACFLVLALGTVVPRRESWNQSFPIRR